MLGMFVYRLYAVSGPYSFISPHVSVPRGPNTGLLELNQQSNTVRGGMIAVIDASLV